LSSSLFLISKWRILLENAKRNQVYRGYTRESIKKKKKKAIQGFVLLFIPHFKWLFFLKRLKH
jgi:hypothetical protein